jgi:hypothetical protein
MTAPITQRDFNALFITAVAAVDEDYIRVPVADSAAVIRERAFAYELYHQLRLRCVATGYTLTGELEKASHSDMTDPKVKRLAPDLLLHIPGNRSGNFMAIEIKGGRPRPDRLRKDLNSLSFLRDRFGYDRLLYLIYGVTEQQAADIAALIKRYARLTPRRLSLRQIELWVRHLDDPRPRLIDWSAW